VEGQAQNKHTADKLSTYKYSATSNALKHINQISNDKQANKPTHIKAAAARL
jgi:hypothetical protein